MAPRKKNTTTIENNTKTQKEVELENELLELKKMIADLAKNKVAEPQQIVTEQYDNIPFNKLINVMSLKNHHLSLSTGGYGKGVIYDFPEFGMVQPIVYSDLSNIISNNTRFTRDGYYYILDEQVVKTRGLTQYYQKFLDKEKIMNIMSLDINEISMLFKNTTESIRETIVSMIKERLLDGESVDLNKLQVISDIYGEDIYSSIKEIKNKSK